LKKTNCQTILIYLITATGSKKVKVSALILTAKPMLKCINDSGKLGELLEFMLNNDYDINDEFETMFTRFGLNEQQMISLVTTLDISLLDDHYTTIWDSLKYYSMACMDDYKTAYIESLYKTDLMDARIELLCDELQEYIKCNSCINLNTSHCSTFKDACKMHHDTCVKYLLNNPQKHDVDNDVYNYCRNYGNTNIIDYICLCGGSLDVIKYLFETQKKDCTDNVIDYASHNCHLDVIKYLFEIQKKDCSTDAINNASYHGHLEIVKYLFEIQKKDCKRDPIDLASSNGHLDVVKYLFEIQKKDCTSDAIDFASFNGHLDVVKYLFEIQKKNCTMDAICDAIAHGYLDVIKYLFEIQKKNCSNYATDYACKNGHLDVIKYLFEIQKKDCTNNAIDWASKNGHLDVIKYLFEIQKKNCTDYAITYAKNDTIRDYVKKMKK